jgi:hypothetical protein
LVLTGALPMRHVATGAFAELATKPVVVVDKSRRLSLTRQLPRRDIQSCCLFLKIW